MIKTNFRSQQFVCDTHDIEMRLIYGTYIIRVGMKREGVLTWSRPINEGTNFAEAKAVYHFLQRLPYGVIKSMFEAY